MNLGAKQDASYGRRNPTFGGLRESLIYDYTQVVERVAFRYSRESMPETERQLNYGKFNLRIARRREPLVCY
jgi:hypothetical protein